MRLLRLARTALEAEGLHLRRLVRARGFQAAYGAVAVVFVLLLLLMLHVAAYAALVPSQGPVWAALIVGFVDLVIIAIFAWLAKRVVHDPIAIEARRVRQAAVAQITDGAARAAILAPLVRSQTAKKGFLGAAATAVAVGLLSRR